ncbi:MAG: DNA polymerase/3'-5' exonuclease PolX [Candidatus Omnitrophota bacterium]
MKNIEIAQIFRDIAQILEIKGENPFRIRAYERAAQNLESLSEDLEALAKANRLREIPGIGADLESKINEYLQKGSVSAYEDLKKSIPPALLEILKVPEVGPKTAGLLFHELKISGIADLEKKAKAGKLLGLPGIKEKTVDNILRGIALLKQGRERMNLARALYTAGEFTRALERFPEVKMLSPAGSLRRRKETVRDIDILVVSANPKMIMEHFVRLPQVKDILAHGETKSSILTQDGIQVDVRVVEEKSFGAALLYFTGSKNFNIRLRQMAIKKKLKINEYGIFSGKREKTTYVAGETEKDMFKALGMDYVEPELREDTGEIELALKHRLPQLIALKDVRGDLHCHSQWSDGSHSILELVQAAKKHGYQYIGITDHSQGLRVAHGLSISELKKKKTEIEEINAKLKDFRVLYGTEVDIDSDGNLDYPEKVMAEFDVVVGAVHSGFKQSKEKLTRRLIKACENKNVHIIAHPTGILWGQREAYELDFEMLFKACRDTGTALEINSFYDRLDLNSTHARRAKELGVKLCVNTDAHTTDQLSLMELGVAVARRGWLSAADVLNTLPLEKLLSALGKR